jgi:hypothetical protein
MKNDRALRRHPVRARRESGALGEQALAQGVTAWMCGFGVGFWQLGR